MRKIHKISSVILGLLFIINVNAQTSRIDSLKQLLIKPVADTFKINAYNHLSEYYMFSNPDSGLYYANKGFELAENISDKKGLGVGYRLIALNYHFMSNNDTAIYLIDKACKIFEELNYKDGMSMCYMNQGIFQSKIDELNGAIENYRKALLLFEEDSNYYGVAMCNLNIGAIYNDQSDYIGSISAYLEALQYFVEIQDKEGIASSSLNIGNLYFLIEEFQKAIKHQQKASLLYKELNNKFNESLALNSMGSCYQHLNNTDSALWFFMKAKTIREEIKDHKGLYGTLLNIGSIYLDNQEYKQSKSYFMNALEHKGFIESKRAQIKLYHNLALLDFELKLYPSALQNAKKALEYAVITESLNSQQDIYELLYKIYKKSNQTIKALESHEKYMILKDSILDKNKYEIINGLEAKYQTAEKEKENQKLQFENKLQKQENASIREQNMYILSLSGLTLLLIIGSFMVYKNIQKSKFNKLMLKEIDEQNDIISKNLHDGMSGYLHAIKNRLEFRNEKTKDLDKEIEIIDRSQKELRFLMRQLSAPYYKNKNFDLSQELNELNSFYESTSTFKIDSYFDQSIIWKNISYENKLQIYKLAQELLANVKKHSEATNISLQIIKDNKNLVMSFEDDGKGFDIEESSYGYGLKNIEKRIKELRGELNIDSSIGHGTFITLKIPVLS